MMRRGKCAMNVAELDEIRSTASLAYMDAAAELARFAIANRRGRCRVGYLARRVRATRRETRQP